MRGFETVMFLRFQNSTKNIAFSLLLLCMNLESRVGARGDDIDSLCSALFFVFLTPKGLCPKSINSRSRVAEAWQSFSLCPPNSGLERLTY